MMPAPMSKKMGAPPQGGMENEMEEGAPGTTLPIASYPDLQNAEEGQKVMMEGTVQSNDGESVTIGYDMVKLQVNRADQAVRQMTGAKKPMQERMMEDEE